MGKSLKFIIIGLLILLLVSIFFLLQLFQERQSLHQNYSEIKDKLNTEASDWALKTSRLKEDKERLQTKASQLGQDLGSLKGEQESLQEKYDMLLQEKEELIDKLQSLATTRREMPATSLVERAEPAMPEADEYWAGVIRAKADLELRLSDIKEVVSGLQLKLDTVAKEKNDLSLGASKLEQENQDLSRRVDYNARLAETLSTDLMREQKDKKGILEQFSKIKQENISLRVRMKELDKANFSLKKKLRTIEQERAGLDEKIERMNVSLEKKIEEVTRVTREIRSLPDYTKVRVIGAEEREDAKEVELPPIVVRSDRQDPINELRIISGKIIAINETNNFVVINLGENQGVAIGRKLDVYRNNVAIGRLEVIQARKNISAADIFNVDSRRKIRIGDIVR